MHILWRCQINILKILRFVAKKTKKIEESSIVSNHDFSLKIINIKHYSSHNFQYIVTKLGHKVERTFSLLPMYRFFDKYVSTDLYIKYLFLCKKKYFIYKSAGNVIIKKGIHSWHSNSPIYLVSKSRDDILKIMGGVAFYVHHFLWKIMIRDSWTLPYIFSLVL